MKESEKMTSILFRMRKERVRESSLQATRRYASESDPFSSLSFSIGYNCNLPFSLSLFLLLSLPQSLESLTMTPAMCVMVNSFHSMSEQYDHVRVPSLCIAFFSILFSIIIFDFFFSLLKI